MSNKINCPTFPPIVLRIPLKIKKKQFLRNHFFFGTSVHNGFDEESDIIDVRTHNTDLRNRLSEFSEQYPDCCKLTDDDEQGGLLFEIQKGRLSFRLTAPYSEERRNSLSEYAKKHGINHSEENL